MRVTYSPGALAQLDEIFVYLGNDDPSAAAALTERIERIIMLVGKFPQMGRLTDKPNVRVIGIPQYRYLIFYRILDEQDEVRILRVRHTSRRPLQGYR